MPIDPMERAQRAFDTIRQKDGKGGEALVKLREALNALENQNNDVTTNHLSGRSLGFNSDALRRHLK